MIRALIIDDEARARNVLRSLIGYHVPEITELEVAAGSLEGIEKIKVFKPGLVFLDIEMPYKNGFELLKSLKRWDFDIIYTTAFNKYAINAIRFSALDYLLKPIDVEELRQAVKRHLDKHLSPVQKNKLYENLINNLQNNQAGKYNLTVSTVDGIFFLPTEQIIRCEGDRNYTRFYLTDGRNPISSRTLREYEEILSDYGFIRVHKSHLVNSIFVKNYSSKGYLLLENGENIEVARRRKQLVVETLLKYNKL